MFLVLHNRIFGFNMQIVYVRQNVLDFAKVNKIGAPMISAYVGYLFDKINENRQLADKYFLWIHKTFLRTLIQMYV
ncbi:hypothetical protein AXF42_Ash016165 [Apostasia shenzhenica]|uniref:Uncharacterized protein n=1 Tax=Apostasia shenzhenica TaxID=1088818 RepID=A0A2I0AEM5_9ASPA|nr:hypothetical protein AXF42_Ash016165 [Apostasia shenzhenica]